MAKPKKSFRENPALQFISIVQEEAAEQAEMTEQEAPAPVEAAKAEQPAATRQDKGPEDVPPAAEKEAAPLATAPPPVPMKPDPRFIETKSRRIQLLMRPSLYEAIKARAQAQGTSVNEWIHAVLEGEVGEVQ